MKYAVNFHADDQDTWSPELRIIEFALDEVTSPMEALYLLGSVIAMVETIAKEAGHPVDLVDLLDLVSDRLAKA